MNSKASNAEEEAELFAAFSPAEFEYIPPKVTWEPPCWLAVNAGFRPVSEAAKNALILPISYQFKADAFTRKSANEQISSQIGEEITRLYQKHPLWGDFLYRHESEFLAPLSDLSGLFSKPMRFIPRSEFRKATLDEVLERPADTMEIYLGNVTTNSYGNYQVLRIHSSLWYYHPKQSHLWHEKSIPWELRSEDVLPWIHSSIKRLPKKKQPTNIKTWEKKLLSEYPCFEKPLTTTDEPWSTKTAITLVFGTTDQIGYAYIYHLDRDLIDRILRKGIEIQINASVRSPFHKNHRNLIFHIFTPSPLHAEILEARLLAGEDIYFGLGSLISGMISKEGDSVSCIGVGKAVLKQYCNREGMKLVSYSLGRPKHRLYEYIPLEGNMENVTDAV